MFTGWLNFFFTCENHKNAAALYVANKLRYVCPIITGIVVPVVTIILMIFYAAKGAFDGSPISIWFTICAVLQLPCIYYAIAFILAARERDAWLKEDQKNADEKKDDKQNEESKESEAKEIERPAGSGSKRIGTKMIVGEDIYSMFYMSTFRPEFIYYH